MKIIFSLFISFSFILFSVAQTITDGSASLTIVQDYITGTGCGSNANFDAGNGIDQLFALDWYLGIGDRNSENIPYAYYYTVEDNAITVQYDDVLGVSGLSAELTITLTEMAPVDVQIAQSMTITNNTGAALDIRLFNYLDLDKNNTQSDDAIILLEDDCNFTTQISDAEDPSQTCYYTMNASDGYEIAPFPDLCNKLLDGVDNLNNTGLPLSASDHTQALQYDATIPNGGSSTAVALVTFGSLPPTATADASGQCTFGDDSGGGDCDVVVNDIALDNGSTATSICVDGIPDPLGVVTGDGTGANSGWIITDNNNNNILAIPPAPPFDLDGAGEGTCLIWYVQYNDIGGNEVGNTLADLTGCFALSNSIEVVREICDPQAFDCASNPIVINHNVTCNQGNGLYDVQFTISGGGAGLQGGVYMVTGDFTGMVIPGQVRNITGLAEGTTYNITVVDDGFGCSASITKGPNNCSKLPVELLAFNGEAQTGGNLLKWVTATEIENDYFSLYSSVNGEDFELIHQQEGGGTISTVQKYQFLDRNVSFGMTYYQLRQTDFDGTNKIIAHTSISRGEQTDVVLLDSFPNPFNSELILNIYSNSDNKVIITLNNILGSSITQHRLMLQNGNNTIHLETDDLTRGLYLLNIQSQKNQHSYKLLKD